MSQSVDSFGNRSGRGDIQLLMDERSIIFLGAILQILQLLQVQRRRNDIDAAFEEGEDLALAHTMLAYTCNKGPFPGRHIFQISKWMTIFCCST